jgi:Rrf2 family transcriptional regulator, cysteine metabolism repressor
VLYYHSDWFDEHGETVKFSKKCQYALRAAFELARHNYYKPAKIQNIAKAQGISPRFLEVILNQLRHAGLVDSRRGNEGGYLLARSPAEITVGEIVRCIQGPIAVTGTEAQSNDSGGAVFGDDAFDELWRDVNAAICKVCDSRTIADLVDSATEKQRKSAPNYVI